MANTYELIEAKTLGSAVSTVEFTSIPSTYTDLLFRVSAREASSNSWSDLRIGFNGGTSDFSWRGLYALNTTVGSNTGTGVGGRTVGNVAANTNTSNVFSNVDIYIPNYTSTSYGKSISIDSAVENNGTGNVLHLAAVLWNPSTQAAITSAAFTNSNSSNFMVNSTFYLYGIKNS
jgi:hypothetical protein